MSTTTLAPLTITFPSAMDDAKAFDAWTGANIAARTVARMEARGLEVTWAQGDENWQTRRDEKVGCFTKRGIFRHEEFTAQIDLQGLAADGTEVIVRVRVSRLGKAGKIRSEVFVGAYVGGGLDACGRMHEPRFLCDSRNTPVVAAARAVLGLS